MAEQQQELTVGIHTETKRLPSLSSLNILNFPPNRLPAKRPPVNELPSPTTYNGSGIALGTFNANNSVVHDLKNNAATNETIPTQVHDNQTLKGSLSAPPRAQGFFPIQKFQITQNFVTPQSPILQEGNAQSMTSIDPSEYPSFVQSNRNPSLLAPTKLIRIHPSGSVSNNIDRVKASIPYQLRVGASIYDVDSSIYDSDNSQFGYDNSYAPKSAGHNHVMGARTIERYGPISAPVYGSQSTEKQPLNIVYRGPAFGIDFREDDQGSEGEIGEDLDDEMRGSGGIAEELGAKVKPTRDTVTGRLLYFCTQEGCDKGFTRRYNLISHMRVHSGTFSVILLRGERPFVCRKCNASFSRKHDMNRHMRSLHSSDRPHACPYCDLSFARSDALKRHVESEKRKGNQAHMANLPVQRPAQVPQMPRMLQPQRPALS